MPGVVQIANRSRGTELASRAEVARSAWRRLIGLIGRRELPLGAGLVLPGTPWVHTALMRFPLDLVFYDRRGVVLLVVPSLAPWRLSPFCRRAGGVIELPAGAATASGTRCGDALSFSPLTSQAPLP
ncbi:MAG TPA: DUF192 domain-containing protein [Chloroflexota bacterium]|nr:DUF192 domain-containing protein [Chloroflexota bacterium]